MGDGLKKYFIQTLSSEYNMFNFGTEKLVKFDWKPITAASCDIFMNEVSFVEMMDQTGHIFMSEVSFMKMK